MCIKWTYYFQRAAATAVLPCRSSVKALMFMGDRKTRLQEILILNFRRYFLIKICRETSKRQTHWCNFKENLPVVKQFIYIYIKKINVYNLYICIQRVFLSIIHFILSETHFPRNPFSTFCERHILIFDDLFFFKKKHFV